MEGAATAKRSACCSQPYRMHQLCIGMSALLLITALLSPLYQSSYYAFSVLTYGPPLSYFALLFFGPPLVVLCASCDALWRAHPRHRCSTPLSKWHGITMLCTGIACFVLPAVAFIVLEPIIFGGPNSLGTTRDYSLGPGYYLILLSGICAIASAVAYIEAQRRSISSLPRMHPAALLAAAVMAAAALSLLAYIPTVSFAACSAMKPEAIVLPPGFVASLYTGKVPGARSIALGPSNWLFVGTRGAGVVYAVSPEGAATIFATGLDVPNGVAYDREEGVLYVAEQMRVIAFDGLKSPPAPKSQQPRGPDDARVVVDGLAGPHHHGWKYLRWHEGERALYMSVGAPCNICLRDDDRRFATILRLPVPRNGEVIRPGADVVDAGGAAAGGPSVWASGVRNSIGFDWDPRTGALVFTDNGVDWMGDETPPDELNVVNQPGANFGFPRCFGVANVPYEGSTGGADCTAYTPAIAALGGHVAALGVRIYRGSLFAAAFGRNETAIIATHGSWNRVVPSGYTLLQARLKRDASTGKIIGASVSKFATGWYPEGALTYCGRPVDVEELADGSLVVSDDHSGSLIRITAMR
jgi:glucose/arabinose dehydrogenase